MKKKYVLLFSTFMLSAFNAQADQTEGNIASRQGYQYEDARFENKSFRLFQPLKNKCIGFDSVYDPRKLISADCTFDEAQWSEQRLQYIDGNIKTVLNGNLSAGWDKQKCLTAGKAPHNEVYFTECNGSDAQEFRILKPFTDIGEDRFFISDWNGNCLFNSETATDTTIANCKSAVSPDSQAFELVDVTESIKVRLVNRGWYNMSYVVEHNRVNWTSPWMALDGVRNLTIPTYPPTNIQNIPLYIRTDYGAMNNHFVVEPGDFIEAVSHGTVFNKYQRVEKVSVTPQLKIYSGYHYSDSNAKGPRYLSDNTPNLMIFNNSIRSFEIPRGWTVRFFEELNYQGRYYTRNESSTQDSHVNMNIKSIKILSK